MQTPNGILPVDKPAGWTSFDVLAKLRGALGTRKLGHSGTLDPMATGVLAVFIGKATAAADRQLNHDKTYEATIRLGLRTDTGDITGTALETAPVTVGESELKAVLPQFTGELMQLPPMYSAVKINGQPLYKAARKGQIVERTPRPITVYSIEYLGSPAPGDYTLRVSCSKGTYIRVLAEDIGTALGVPATLAALRRTQAGEFGIEQCHTLPEILAAAESAGIERLDAADRDRVCTAAPAACGQCREKAPAERLPYQPLSRRGRPLPRVRPGRSVLRAGGHHRRRTECRKTILRKGLNAHANLPHLDPGPRPAGQCRCAGVF